jgi:hypothetical protein
MTRAHLAGVLLSVASIAIVISISCNPRDTPNASDTSDTFANGSTSSSSSGREGESGGLPQFEPPATTIEYYDMKARADELAAYHQQHQYGTRIKEELLSRSDPRYQTVAGAIDAIYQHHDLNQTQKFFPRNISVGVLDLARAYRSRSGSFEELLSCKLVDVLVQPSAKELRDGAGAKTVQYVEARCRWSRSVMLCRISFADDPAGKTPPLEAFWLARDPEGPTPSGFAAGGYLKGAGKLAMAHRDENERHETIGKMSASLPAMRIELVSTSGDLDRDAIGLTLWKLYPAPDPAKYPKTGASQVGGASQVSYFWDMEGGFWRSFASRVVNARRPEDGGGPLLGLDVKTPEAGTYRLSTSDRMAMGKPFELDRARPIAKATLHLDPDHRCIPCEIEAVLVDPETGERIHVPDDLGFSYKIYRDGYLPITTKWMDFRGADRFSFEGESRTRYRVELRPGNYRVDVHGGYGRLSENAFGQVSYYGTSPLQVPITVDPARETPSRSLEEGLRQRRHIPLSLPMQTLSPTSEAAEELLPFSVQGTVAREDGRPVPNAKVVVMQSPEELARTTTDENGRYQLRFTLPEVIDFDPLLLSSHDFSGAVAQLQKQGVSFPEASAYVSANISKAFVAVLVEHANLALHQPGRLIATTSMPDVNLSSSSTDPDTGASPRGVAKHFIAPKHPVTNCDLVLATVAQLEAEFVDTEGKRILGGNVLIMDPLSPSRRLIETRDQTGLHHVKDVVTTKGWLVSTIGIGGMIDYLEQPVIQLPEPGLWKITFQVVPSPIIDPANDALWEATKVERVGNRGKPADGPTGRATVRSSSALDKPIYREDLTTLRILKVTRPNGSNVDPSLVLQH